MVFSSYAFVFLFLPVVLAGYYLLSKTKKKMYQHIFLVFASLFFYGYFNITYLFVIVASIIVNYVLAKLMITRSVGIDGIKGREITTTGKQRIILILGILFNIGLLGYFKYYDFFVENINSVFGSSMMLKHIILPLGISFFTFQQLFFLVSIYKGEEKLEKFVDYCVFVLFFPQLAAGPIVLYSEMMPQFTDDKRRYFNYNNFAKGIYVFVIGLFKKAVIADTLALFVDNGFGSSELGFSAAWIVALSYTLQIYFDFSGYSDMAIGLGLMFNINLPVNFLSPYKSESITEFWRKWHITLGRALSSFIYIPLGGNRKKTYRVCINLFITFFISGLWHGAAWSFVVWGMLHGIAVVIERIARNALDKVPKVLKIAGTFFTVNCVWVLFRATSFSQAASIYKSMLDIRNINLFSISHLSDDGLIGVPAIVSMAYILAIIAGLLLVVFFTKNTIEKAETFSLNSKSMITTVILFCISVIHFSRESIFIYFNF